MRKGQHLSIRIITGMVNTIKQTVGKIEVEDFKIGKI